MPDIIQKRQTLEELIRYLAVFIDMLAKDSHSGYAGFFEPHLINARKLYCEGFTFEDLKELSYSLDGLFTKGFLDYSPSVFDKTAGYFKAIEGTEDYYNVFSKVSALALELRVIGSY